MTYIPQYNKSRFPMQIKRTDGTWGCRGCGGDIPKGRQTWCSRECVDRFDPQRVVFFVKQRDKGICQLCGVDTAQARADYYHLRRTLTAIEALDQKSPAPPEYDHIIPMCEGGLTVLENMRTLCRACHRTVTADLAARRAQKRKEKAA